jgi:DNA modification methylase
MLHAGLFERDIKIELVPARLLKPAAYNPRKWDDAAATQLTRSIREFGLVDPILANGSPERRNVVIGGHFRLKIAKDLGYTEVPVVYLNIPDERKEKELNIRLNKNTGDWDFDKLKSFDFDFLADIGFDKIELSDLWDKDLETADDEFDVEGELKKIKKPKTKLGDLIILGNHKLACGDATDPSVLIRLFGKERASMIYSDPVYNIKINYGGGISGRQNYGGNVNDDRSESEYKEFLKKSMVNALSVTKENAHVFYWSDQKYIGLIQELYRELKIENKRVCLWIKNAQNPTPGVAFNKCYEPCTYGVRGKPYISKSVQNLNEVMNKEITTGNNLLAEALDHLDLWMVKRLSGKEYEHATSKPPVLHQKAIRRCTKSGDIILDSFSGSASTMIAAEQLKRRVYAVELEPAFCDLAIRRYEKLTGVKAKIIHEEA